MNTKKKSRRKYFYAWLRNYTDSRDNEPTKVKAASVEEAREILERTINHNRFSLGTVYDNLKKFRKTYDWIWGISEYNGR